MRISILVNEMIVLDSCQIGKTKKTFKDVLDTWILCVFSYKIL